MTFSISSGQEYDLFGNTALANASTVGALGPFTGADNDNDFEIDEDVTGDGNLYKGLLNIGGTDYPVVTGSTLGVPDLNILLVVVPVGEVTPTFPATFDVFPDLAQSTYFYCFTEGTLIVTEDGQMAVEDLTQDHKVASAEGTFVPVKWLGRQTVTTRYVPSSRLSMVRIKAGALGRGLPERELVVTGDHGMIVDGFVINASVLVNGTTIDFVPRAELPETFTIYNVETETQTAIFANGAPAETFFDSPGRMAFDNYQEYLDLFGVERIVPLMDLPRVTSRRLLPDAIKARLGIVEEAVGFGQPLSA